MTELNGAHEEKAYCPLWNKHREQIISAIIKVDTMHDGMVEMVKHTHHLQALSDIRDTLIGAATGKDHVPTKVFLIVLAALGTVIVGLVFILIFLLTGEVAGWIEHLHR